MNKQKLASRIWETANNLRSKIKSNEYKDYILGFMFYKYISDKEEKYVFDRGGTVENLKGENAKSRIQTDIGYFIEYNNLFSVWKNMGVSLGAATVSTALSEFNRNINPSYKKVFENIFATLEGGLSKLGDSSGSRDKAVRDIVDLISDIPTTNDNYDVFGYIYEYLIFKFSTAAKDDGAFYTPHEVSSLIAKIVADAMKDRKELNVYDPTSGSGSLLLNIGKEASKYINKDNIRYFGQEKINETYHLTRMNLIMKGIGVSNIFVRNGDTLEDDWPYFDEETQYEPLRVDAVTSNPPYSLVWNNTERENDPRFKYGLAPSGKADYAFLLHCLFHLQKDGIMAIVLPHGVLFRGASEGVIRKNLIENNHIETIIGLPSNLFYATGIPTIIMILRKNRESSDVLFVDASQSFEKSKNQNVLRESDIKKIFDAVKNRKDIDHFCRVVEKSEIIANEYNLNIPRYVSAAQDAEKYDLYSVMSGAVSDKELLSLSNFWSQFPDLYNDLFVKENGYNTFKNTDIQEVVMNDQAVKDFKDDYANLGDQFKSYLIETLIDNFNLADPNTKDRVVDKLFEIIGDNALVDKYAVYQYLAEHWDEIENDLIAIKENGMQICKQVEPNMVFKKDSKTKKTNEVQEGWKGTIIPFDLAQKMFFDKEFELIADLQSEIDNATSEASELEDEFDESFKEQEGNFKDKRSEFIANEILRPLTRKMKDYSAMLSGYKKDIPEPVLENMLNKKGTEFDKSKIKKLMTQEPSEMTVAIFNILEKQAALKKVLDLITKMLMEEDMPLEKIQIELNTFVEKEEIMANISENEEFLNSLNRRIALDVIKSEKNKEIKNLKEEIEDKTKEKIENLTDDEIKELLTWKWINPIVDGMNETCKNSINNFVKELITLKDKYADNLNDINDEIHKVDEELFSLMDELTGSETDMMAIQMLKDALK